VQGSPWITYAFDSQDTASLRRVLGIPGLDGTARFAGSFHTAAEEERVAQ
jgi:hypothetical protein